MSGVPMDHTHSVLILSILSISQHLLDGISNPCTLIKLLLDKYLLRNQKHLFNVAWSHHQARVGENILLEVVLEPFAIRPAQPHLHNPYCHPNIKLLHHHFRHMQRAT